MLYLYSQNFLYGNFVCLIDGTVTINGVFKIEIGSKLEIK